MEVEPEVRAGDYLHGFLLGTREALYENGRDSVTITIDEVRASTIGMLIALYERAVGLYAELVNINAYHQPGWKRGRRRRRWCWSYSEKSCRRSAPSRPPAERKRLRRRSANPIRSRRFITYCVVWGPTGDAELLSRRPRLPSRRSLAARPPRVSGTCREREASIL